MEKRGESTEGYHSSEVENQQESSRMPVPPVDWNAMLSSNAFSDPEIQPLLKALVPSAINRLSGLG